MVVTANGPVARYDGNYLDATDWMRMLGIGKTTLNELIDTGEFEAIPIGLRTVLLRRVTVVCRTPSFREDGEPSRG